jgi:hypothetical protein
LVLNFGPNPNWTELDRSSVWGSGLGLNRTNSPVQGSGGGRTWRNCSEPGLNPKPEGPLVVVALHAASSLPCAPRRRRPARRVIVALRAASSSPCAPRRRRPACHIAVALCAASPLPCAPCRRCPVRCAAVNLRPSSSSTCAPCRRHPVRRVAVDLHPSSSPPCVPHHCHPACRVIVALCTTSLLPCAPCHHRPARHVVVSLHTTSPLPYAPHRGPVCEPANPNLCGRITGFSVRFWFSPWRTPNQTVRTILSGSGSGSEISPNRTDGPVQGSVKTTPEPDRTGPRHP